MKTEEIYSNGSATSGSITLNSSMDNYDYLYIFIKRTNGVGWTSGVIRVSDFKLGNELSFVSCEPNNTSRVFTIYGINVIYESSTKIKIQKNCDVALNTSGIAGGPTTGGSLSIKNIVGVKLIDGN